MMDEMIFKKAAIDAITKAYDQGTILCLFMRSLAIKAVNTLPSVDAVPVVRCKDCKHSEHWYRDKRRCFLWHETGIGVFEDGYCNYAERREE